MLPRGGKLDKASHGIFHNIREISYTCTAEYSFKTRLVNSPFYDLTPEVFPGKYPITTKVICSAVWGRRPQDGKHAVLQPHFSHSVSVS